MKTRVSSLALPLAISLTACGSGKIGGSNNGGVDAKGGGPGVPDSNVPLPDAPPPITPGDPGQADVHVTVDSTRDVHAISPFIYGNNGPDWTANPTTYTMVRSGGNRLTAYNWENNASNAGTDYMNENDDYLGGGDTPGKAVTDVVAAAHQHDAAAILTVPIQGYVAADKDPPGDVDMTPNYLTTRFKVSKSTKGAPFSNPPDTTDGFVYQDEFVSFVEAMFPESRTDAMKTIFYDLDNEPDLWSSTHPRIHPNPVTYAELIADDLDYGHAIHRVQPLAKVLGFVSYGWAGYTTLQGASDANNRDFIDTYLDAMAADAKSTGSSAIDVLDLHWYPEATGGGTRIITDDTNAALSAARVQAPRSLWDPTYVESSWITQDSTGGKAIELIPLLQGKIAQHDPGIQLSFSEYYYGGGDDISGCVAEADVLGVLGQYGVFAASLWPSTGSQAFITAGFEMFRNAGGGFADTSIHADSDHVDLVSAYASQDSANYDRIVIVLINRSTATKTAGLEITHGVQFKSAQVWQVTSASTTPAQLADIPITLTNAFVASLPAMSVTTLVLQP